MVVDTPSFDHIYSTYFDAIYRYIYRRLLNKENAEDIVSDTFLKVYQHLPRFVPQHDVALTCWVYTIAKNELRQFMRKKNNSPSPFLLENDLPTPDGTVDALDNAQLHTLLMPMIQKLPASDQELIISKYFDELHNKEIAELLHITPNTIGVRLHRALQKLKKIMADNQIVYEID